ncbi:VIR protein [Plasmodium vivax]|uniref:VIR protein n=1 Tax=Plasmodium vivax TaxID=5855 RepID=A0A1G4E8T2_PLAVI|nr:VIR protein [Plasmodium vivax]
MSQVKTVESEVDDMVLTYNEYIKLKEEFNPKKKISLGDVKLDDILVKAKITGTWKKNYYNAFDILLNHIHRDGLFYHGNNPEACKYINYILYEEVERKNVRSYDKELISHFHEFLDAYGKKRSNQKRCISSIYNIQRETYNKINALYEVYDKYYTCSFYKGENVKLGCKVFKDFFDSYNNYMRDIVSKSPKFNDILENIEIYAKDAFSKYINGCKKDDYYIRSPHLFKPPPEQKHENHNQAQMSPTPFKPADSILPTETLGRTQTLQTELTNDIPKLKPIQENQETDEEHGANVIHSTDDSYHGSSHLETIDPPIIADGKPTHMFSRFPEPFGHSYSSGTLYSGHDGHVREQAFSKEVELPPSSVMSTITNALKDVDPVPVVGVSGGMGALFLLFRYTPFGNFFRGGRGRVHRIPRSFNGPFPGEFPNFHEYEGGYIGYGPMNPLAE